MAARSLLGRTVVITRSEEKAESLRAELEARGATVLLVPVIRHAAEADGSGIGRAVRERRRYSHLVFTSQTAARFFVEASSRLGVPVAEWAPLCIAAVGPRTAAAIEELGLKPTVMAVGAGGAALARQLLEGAGLRPHHRVLLPQSSAARPELQRLLEAAGIAVDAVPVYRTLPEDPSKIEPFLRLLRQERPPDAITFASPSAFHALLVLAGEENCRALERGETRIVSIGPTTSEEIRRKGFPVAAEADLPTPQAVADAVGRALGGPGR